MTLLGATLWTTTTAGRGEPGVARGYLNQPGLTAQRFVPDPFSPEPGARMYKTGDLGRWGADGNLRYLGRNDLQVKIRGFRVELGEIESRLLEHPSVAQAAVLARSSGAEAYLAAYVVSRDRVHDPEALEAELKRALGAALPAYMVPQVLRFRDALPHNESGKLDRARLSQDLDTLPRASVVAPRTATEQTLATLWCALMGLETVGVQDNFFEIGGQSMTAIRLVSAITDAFGLKLDTRFIFEFATIESLGAQIDSLKWALENTSRAERERQRDDLEVVI